MIIQSEIDQLRNCIRGNGINSSLKERKSTDDEEDEGGNGIFVKYTDSKLTTHKTSI